MSDWRAIIYKSKITEALLPGPLPIAKALPCEPELNCQKSHGVPAAGDELTQSDTGVIGGSNVAADSGEAIFPSLPA